MTNKNQLLLLSIVVPVYNVEHYLIKCINSLLNQDLPQDNYEIIIINDGSIDKSGIIAAEFAQKYSNIRLINQKNKGLGAARNTGIHQATGKYIQFVDSDDYIEPWILKALIDKMDREQLDILRFNYQNVDELYRVVNSKKHDKKNVDYSDNITDGISFLNNRLGFACYVWQFIIKSELLKIDGNGFKPGIYFEDTEWTPRVLVQTNKVTSTNIVVYNYLAREGSITKSISLEKKRKLIEDKLFIIDSLIIQRDIYIEKAWYNKMIALTVLSMITDMSVNLYLERKNYLSQLEQKVVFPLLVFGERKAVQYKIRLINISPTIFCWLINVINRK